MGFGGLWPCPIRLGGSTEDGWPASQHARSCADLVAAQRTIPLCVFTLSCNTLTGAVSFVDYFGRNGMGAAIAGPAVIAASIDTGTKLLTLTLSPFVDELGALHNWCVQSAVACAVNGTTVALTSLTPQTNTVVFDLSATSGFLKLAVKLSGQDRPVRIEDYGGLLTKRNSKHEGDTPYSFAYLTDFRTMRGTVYRIDGLMGVENLAWARLLQLAMRILEKYVASNSPSTADGPWLARWGQWFGVFSPEDPEWKLRVRCAAHALLLSGGIENSLELICRWILGNAFVSLDRDQGSVTDWDNPALPVPTYWEMHAGAGELDLNATLPTDEVDAADSGASPKHTRVGTWMSWRSHVKVTVQVVPGLTLQDLYTLCDRELSPLLDIALPAVASYSWGRTGGFALGQSKLGLDTL